MSCQGEVSAHTLSRIANVDVAVHWNTNGRPIQQSLRTLQTLLTPEKDLEEWTLSHSLSHTHTHAAISNDSFWNDISQLDLVHFNPYCFVFKDGPSSKLKTYCLNLKKLRKLVTIRYMTQDAHLFFCQSTLFPNISRSPLATVHVCLNIFFFLILRFFLLASNLMFHHFFSVFSHFLS